MAEKIRLDFEQREEANSLLDRMSAEEDLEQYAWEIISLRARAVTAEVSLEEAEKQNLRFAKRVNEAEAALLEARKELEVKNGKDVQS
jgi:hypothetical protein